MLRHQIQHQLVVIKGDFGLDALQNPGEKRIAQRIVIRRKITPIFSVTLFFSALLEALGIKLCYSAIFKMCFLVSTPISGRSFKAFETVDCETLANLAISLMVMVSL
jgi:hypothetical protein